MTVDTLRAQRTLTHGLAAELAYRVLGSLRHGRVDVWSPDGTLRSFGPADAAERATLRVQSNELFTRLLLGGELAFGETYTDGLWDTDDLAALLRLAILNRSTAPLPLKLLNNASRFASRRLHLMRRNTREGSRRNIAAHYDLGNEFFAAFLDDSMAYSSGVFERADDSLEAAQARKFDLICAKADLRPDHKLLEIGCGWGGFAIHAARTTGCHVDAITISREQAELARRRVAQAGLDGRVQILLEDYRDVRGVYDRIVSIEMLEAVGAEYFDTYFRACSDLLKPGGRFVLQSISVPERTFEALRTGVNWMQKYIFPGGMLPSLTRIERAIAPTGLVISSVEDIATSYVLTLQNWRRRFETNLAAVRSFGFEERFIRAWRYYLSAAEAGFATRSTGDLQIVLDKPRAWS